MPGETAESMSTPDVAWGLIARFRDPDGNVLQENQPKVKHEAHLDPDGLRRTVRPLLGGVKTPKRIDVVAELPRNDNGKILKRVLVDERR